MGSVVCDVAEADCAGSFFEATYVSARSGCCLCEAGCPMAKKATCRYYDAKPSTTTAPATETTAASAPATETEAPTTTEIQTTSGVVHMRSATAVFCGALISSILYHI